MEGGIVGTKIKGFNEFLTFQIRDPTPLTLIRAVNCSWRPPAISLLKKKRETVKDLIRQNPIDSNTRRGHFSNDYTTYGISTFLTTTL